MEILDPGVEANFFSAERLSEVASHIANSEHFWARVLEITPQVEETYSHLPSATKDELCRFLYSNIVSLFALSPVFEDGRGRALPHISGEISRIHYQFQREALRAGCDLDVLPDGCNIIDNTNNEPPCSWKSPETCMQFPTFDGLPFDKPRPLIGPDGTEFPQLPLHRIWSQSLETMLGMNVTDGLFQIIKPPFMTNAGQIYAGIEPVFLIPKIHRSIGSEDTPNPIRPELVPC